VVSICDETPNSLLPFGTKQTLRPQLVRLIYTLATTPTSNMASTGVNPAIFQDLQTRIDGDGAVREVMSAQGEAREHALTTRQELRDIVQALEKQSTSRPQLQRPG
jgi:hypothetical protein